MTPLDITLTDLIAALDDELPDADALTRISEAHLRSQTLSDLGEQLVDHYVSQAKQDGASWTAVGDALGVSKQAAQQRRTAAPFDGFTRLARHSVVLAQEAARTYKHELIGTDHLLLGLLGEPQGAAYEILTADGRSERAVREAVTTAMPPKGAKMLRGHIAFAPASRLAIDEARRSAETMGLDWIGTEHLLVGVMRTGIGAAAQVLGALGFTMDTLDEAVARATRARSDATDR